MSMSMIDGYLTAHEAAAVIGVSHAQVTRYVANGSLAAVRVGNQILLRERDVKRFKRPPRGNPQFLEK